MKKLIISSLIFLSFILNAKNEIKIIHSDVNSVTLEYNFSGLQTAEQFINGNKFYNLSAEACVAMLNKGMPQMLRNTVSLAVPYHSQARLEVIASEFTEMNDISVIPSKGSLTRNINPNNVPFEFGNAYFKNAFYPAVNVEATANYLFRGQQGITLSFYPVQTNPVTKKLKIITKFVVKVTYVNSNNQPLSFEMPEFKSGEEKEMFMHRFLNIKHASTASKTNYTQLNEFGDMLIIYHPAFYNQMKPLADWKIQKGMNTEMVSTALTGTTGSAIQSYVQGYYNAHPNLLYVLLVGDHQQINAFNAGPAGSETKWSDSYYAFVSGLDKYPDIMVGRFSSADTNDIITMVNRTLEYEKNPAIGSWYNLALGIGSDEGAGIGDENEADWQHLRNIGNKLTTGGGYSYFHEFFDGSQGGNDATGNPSQSMVSTAVNDGVSIFMYTGHGSQNACATSNYNITSINTCTNNGKYPFSVQVACNNGTFINGTCFSEAFLRAKNANGPTGAIASVGSSILMAWAEPMDTQDEIGDIMSNIYANNKKYTIGGLFYNGQMHMLDMYPTATGEEVMETWVMFGDPSAMIRTQTPTNLSSSYYHCVLDYATSFSITSSAGPNAFACLTQNGQIIGSGPLNNTTTSIALTNTFSVSQDVILTITEFNKIPVIDTIPVCITTSVKKQSNIENFYIKNPVQNNQLELFYKNVTPGEITIKIFNLQGKLVFNSPIYINTNGSSVLDIENLEPSVYMVQVVNSSNHKTNFKIVKE